MSNPNNASTSQTSVSNSTNSLQSDQTSETSLELDNSILSPIIEPRLLDAPRHLRSRQTQLPDLRSIIDQAELAAQVNKAARRQKRLEKLLQEENEPAVSDSEDMQNEVDMDDVIKLLKASTSKNVPLRDLPTFSGQSHEDANDFLLKLERCGVAYGWTDAEYLKYMSLTMEKSALRWFDANKTVQTFSEMKKKFLETFGRSQVDYDLLGESGKMAINEDPLAYIFHVLRYVKAISPNATEPEQVNKLFEGLPPHLKACFVRDRPTTVELFTERLKDVAREYAYKQKALFQENLLNPYALSNPYGTVTPSLFPYGNNFTLSNPYGAVTSSSLPSGSNYKLSYQPVVTPAFANVPASGSSNNSAREQSSESALRNQVDNLTNQLQTLMQNQGPTPPRNPNIEQTGSNVNSSRTPDGRPICFTCRRVGHVQRFCRFRNTGNRGRGRDRYNGSTGNRSQNFRNQNQSGQPTQIFIPSQNQPQSVYFPQPLTLPPAPNRTQPAIVYYTPAAATQPSATHSQPNSQQVVTWVAAEPGSQTPLN